MSNNDQILSGVEGSRPLRIGPAGQREVSLIVCTHERPVHLERCLESVSCQTVLSDLELIVSDDGSSDETREVVRRFAERDICPVYFATQEHDGFRVARVRNNGVATSNAPYLVFADGDCAMPHRHVEDHLDMRATDVVIVGDSVRWDASTSRRATTDDVLQDRLGELTPQRQARWLRKKMWKDRWYSWLNIPMRPRLTANNFSMWRADYERVNGFDETYVGWGLEDVDLQRRLALLNLRFQTILHRTSLVHFWHPRHETFSRNAEGSANRSYYEQGIFTASCRLGFSRTKLGDFESVNMTDQVRAERDSAHRRAA